MAGYDPGVRTIALVDHTRQYRPAPGVLKAIAEALTIQVERDFAPAWNLTAVRFAVGGRGDKIHFFDSAQQADDYGWHAVDGDGLPYSHVFAEPSITAGSGWITGLDSLSSTASHEALEMLADPTANGYSFDGRRRLWAQEVCDPVQARCYRITAKGMRIPMSDFVLPPYFDRHAAGPYDHLRVLAKPFSIDKGGYALYQRSSAVDQKNRRRFEVVFDKSVPRWLRTQTLEGWGRTCWRLVLNP